MISVKRDSIENIRTHPVARVSFFHATFAQLCVLYVHWAVT